MDTQLYHELMLLQQSRCSKKYNELMDDFQEIPEKINESITKPMHKFHRGISRLVKNRGRMLFLLDKKVSAIFKKYSK